MTDKRPRLLDLFCCAGGAARGYQRAGFHVTGVDVQPQPRYAGDEFVQGDALCYLRRHGDKYDAIHASPPCQAFTQVSNRWRQRESIADGHIDLLTPTRAALARYLHPWVIENVMGARHKMDATVMLHGGMFGLKVHRPRLFEANIPLPSVYAPRVVDAIGVYGKFQPGGRWLFRRKDGTKQRCAGSVEEAGEAMGIDWMVWDELREAIPPAYTEWIGKRLIRHIKKQKKVNSVIDKTVLNIRCQFAGMSAKQNGDISLRFAVDEQDMPEAMKITLGKDRQMGAALMHFGTQHLIGATAFGGLNIKANGDSIVTLATTIEDMRLPLQDLRAMLDAYIDLKVVIRNGQAA